MVITMVMASCKIPDKIIKITINFYGLKEAELFAEMQAR